jgi:hypothetical protein
MSRKTIREIKVETNLRCNRVYSVEQSSKELSNLQTIGIKLTQKQAIELSRALLLASQDWDEMEITGYRFNKRSDNTYPLTLTTNLNE